MLKIQLWRRSLRWLDRLLEAFVAPEFVSRHDAAPPTTPASHHIPRVS